MPMQNAALWILLVGRLHKHELSLPEAQDDTITEPLREGWGYDVRRHDYRCKGVRSSCAKVSYGQIYIAPSFVTAKDCIGDLPGDYINLAHGLFGIGHQH